MARWALQGLVFIPLIPQGRERQSMNFSSSAKRQDSIYGVLGFFFLDHLDENGWRKGIMETNGTLRKLLYWSSPERMVA